MRRRPFTSLSAAAALIGLLASSTVIAWALPCADACVAPPAHDCCPASGDEPPAQARISATSCCGSAGMALCGGAVHFNAGHAVAAQSHTELPAATLAAAPRMPSPPAPRARALAPPAQAPVLPFVTRTIVLLL